MTKGGAGGVRQVARSPAISPLLLAVAPLAVMTHELKRGRFDRSDSSVATRHPAQMSRDDGAATSDQPVNVSDGAKGASAGAPHQKHGASPVQVKPLAAASSCGAVIGRSLASPLSSRPRR